MKDLAPTIYRQRMIIEGRTELPIVSAQIKEYLAELSQVLEMVVLAETVIHKSERFGWCGWINWETSGAHFYAWKTPFPFFSVDIYTCKYFHPRSAVDFTKEYFDPLEMVSKTV